MSEEISAYRRLLDRFGKRTEKLGHLHHTGETRSSVKNGICTVDLTASVGRYSALGAISDRSLNSSSSSWRRTRDWGTTHLS
jgi:hypothetical protein